MSFTRVCTFLNGVAWAGFVLMTVLAVNLYNGSLISGSVVCMPAGELADAMSGRR